ncbi:hypothetical protein Dimus_039743 [Dionaea muscipula]
MEMEDHLTQEGPSTVKEPLKAKIWARDDARLYTRLINSMESQISTLVSHCDSVKELWEYLVVLYSGKDNVNRLYDVSQSLFRPHQGDLSLRDYFASYKKLSEEFNVLMPISADVAKMREQREQLLIMAFLSGLRSEHDFVRSQILASKETSLTEAFSRANRAIRPSSDSSSFSGDRAALASSGGPRGRGRGRGGDCPFCTHCQRPGHIIETCYQLHGRPSSTATSTLDGRPTCTHCKAPGHTRDRCFKLHGRPPASRSANVTSSGEIPSPTRCRFFP